MARTKKKNAPPPPSPSGVPLYTLWDVARYLRVPLWSISALSGRFHEWMEPEFFFHRFWRGIPHARLFEDELPPVSGHPGDTDRIPFVRLASLFVRVGVLRALADWPRVATHQMDRWESLHRTIVRWLEDTQSAPVPFDGASVEERIELIARPIVGRLEEPQLALVRKNLALRLERVESAGGVPVRIYPPSRIQIESSPRIVVLDPLVRFGRPTLVGRGLPTDVLFERYQAGDTTTELAEDYGIATDEIEEAIRFESGPTDPPFPLYGW